MTEPLVIGFSIWQSWFTRLGREAEVESLAGGAASQPPLFSMS